MKKDRKLPLKAVYDWLVCLDLFKFYTRKAYTVVVHRHIPYKSAI